jgi:hypothetical protein
MLRLKVALVEGAVVSYMYRAEPSDCTATLEQALEVRFSRRIRSRGVPDKETVAFNCYTGWQLEALEHFVNSEKSRGHEKDKLSCQCA